MEESESTTLELNQDNKIDELILELQKNSEGDEFASLAAETIFLARKMREIKENLETGVYKTKQIEDLYRLQLMSYDIRSSENMMKMNKLLSGGNLLKVIKLQARY